MRSLLIFLMLAVAGVGVARAEETCALPPYAEAGAGEDDPAALLRDMRPVLTRFPSLAEALESGRPALCLSDRMNDAYGFLDTETRRIVISRSLPRALRLGVLLHELRHLWQSERGACPTDALDMKEYARATFAIEADASAISLLIAWDMKEHGQADVWDALAAWPQQADIAASFSRAMDETGDRVLATTAAYYQWYDSEERRHDYYIASCSDYLDRQDESHLIPRYQMIESGFFEHLCRMPDGSRYECADPRGP